MSGINRIKIGVCQTYCCQEPIYEICHVLNNNMYVNLNPLLIQYTVHKQNIMKHNPFTYLLENNNVLYEETTKDEYDKCKFRLYCQNC